MKHFLTTIAIAFALATTASAATVSRTNVLTCDGVSATGITVRDLPDVGLIRIVSAAAADKYEFCNGALVAPASVDLMNEAETLAYLADIGLDGLSVEYHRIGERFDAYGNQISDRDGW